MRASIAFAAATIVRAALLYFGYTDIDYLVFTDAARFLSSNRSPYDRATYRYTPLLAWLLYPTTWVGLWFEFGKVLFCIADILTGWLIIRILRKRMSPSQATNYACIWLLNPIVASISARGSSEGVVSLLTVALLWATLERRIDVAGILLGVAVHFKIYPFIYAASMILWLDSSKAGSIGSAPKDRDRPQWLQSALTVVNPMRVRLALSSFITFMALNLIMMQ